MATIATADAKRHHHRMWLARPHKPTIVWVIWAWQHLFCAPLHNNGHCVCVLSLFFFSRARHSVASQAAARSAGSSARQLVELSWAESSRVGQSWGVIDRLALAHLAWSSSSLLRLPQSGRETAARATIEAERCQMVPIVEIKQSCVLCGCGLFSALPKNCKRPRCSAANGSASAGIGLYLSLISLLHLPMWRTPTGRPDVGRLLLCNPFWVYVRVWLFFDATICVAVWKFSLCTKRVLLYYKNKKVLPT